MNITLNITRYSVAAFVYLIMTIFAIVLFSKAICTDSRPLFCIAASILFTTFLMAVDARRAHAWIPMWILLPGVLLLRCVAAYMIVVATGITAPLYQVLIFGLMFYVVLELTGGVAHHRLKVL